MGKLPAFMFYPGDWQKDPCLRRCSKAAKGVWIDMLCLLFECPVRGSFVDAGGQPWSDQEIAEAIGGDVGSNLGHISELVSKGVAHRDNRGAIFSRRMVRDEQSRLGAKERMRKHRSPSVTQVVTEVLRPSSVNEYESETEVAIEDLKPKPEEDLFDVQQATTYVFLELGLAGNEARMLANDAVKAYIHRHKCTPRDAAEGLVALKFRYDAEVTEFRCGVINWLKAGVWKDPEKWQKNNGQTQLTKTEERVVSNARAAAASLGMGHSGYKNGDAGRPTETPSDDGRRLQTLENRTRGKILSGD